MVGCMHKNFLYFLLKHKVLATCVQRWGIFCSLTRYGSTLFVPLQKKTFLGHFLKALVPRLYVGQKVHFPCIMYLMQPHQYPTLGSVKKGVLARRVLTPRGKLSTAIYDLLSNSMRVLQTLTEEAQRRLISRFSIGYLMQCLQKPIRQKLFEVQVV